MQTKIENLSSTKKKINVDLPTEEVKEAFTQAFKKIGKKADIKGFRKGKIPETVLEQYYGSDIMVEAMNHLINETYPKALSEHQLRPVLEPKFDLHPIEKGKNYHYHVEVEVIPPFEVKDYKGLVLKKHPVEIKEEEVENELKRLQESQAQLAPLEGDEKLAKGLVALLDIEGAIDGKPFKGSQAKGYMLEFGQGHFFKEFEDNIEGMKKGEEKRFEMTLPQDYPDQELKGKKALFHVVVQGLHQKKLSPLDDEFAKDLGKDNIAVLREDIKEKLNQSKEKKLRQEYIQEALEKLASQVIVELPEGLLKHEMEHSKEEKPAVEKRLKSHFILEAIAAKEAIKMEPKDIEARFRQISMLSGQPITTIHNYYREPQHFQQLATQITLEKTLDFVVDQATLKE